MKKDIVTAVLLVLVVIVIILGFVSVVNKGYEVIWIIFLIILGYLWHRYSGLFK